MSKEKTKTEQALASRREALVLRNDPRLSSPSMAAAYARQADGLMTVDPDGLDIQSGELMHDPDDLDATCYNPLSDAPDQAAVEASLARTNMLGKLDCTGLALDAANSIGARNSLERMLAHQMAACHQMAMEMITEAGEIDFKYRLDANTSNVIQARKINSANRLMQTFQQAMLTLQKVRTGGKQTVTVQHVNVNDGGQAVVTGNLNRGDAAGGHSDK